MKKCLLFVFVAMVLLSCIKQSEEKSTEVVSEPEPVLETVFADTLFVNHVKIYCELDRAFGYLVEYAQLDSIVVMANSDQNYARECPFKEGDIRMLFVGPATASTIYRDGWFLLAIDDGGNLSEDLTVQSYRESHDGPNRIIAVKKFIALHGKIVQKILRAVDNSQELKDAGVKIPWNKPK